MKKNRDFLGLLAQMQRNPRWPKTVEEAQRHLAHFYAVYPIKPPPDPPPADSPQ